jgi:hypothetical protein
MIGSILGSLGTALFIGIFLLGGCFVIVLTLKWARRHRHSGRADRHLSLEEVLQMQDRQVEDSIRQARRPRVR